jgi:hypothetical protein
MRRIDDRRHTSDHPTLPSGKKELHLGMLKEGILSYIEKRFAFKKQRRHPLGVVPIDQPGKLEEGIDLARL